MKQRCAVLLQHQKEQQKDAQSCNITQKCSKDNIIASQKNKIAIPKAINYIIKECTKQCELVLHR